MARVKQRTTDALDCCLVVLTCEAPEILPGGDRKLLEDFKRGDGRVMKHFQGSSPVALRQGRADGWNEEGLHIMGKALRLHPARKGRRQASRSRVT